MFYVTKSVRKFKIQSLGQDSANFFGNGKKYVYFSEDIGPLGKIPASSGKPKTETPKQLIGPILK